jgi:hypothetical protein
MTPRSTKKGETKTLDSGITLSILLSTIIAYVGAYLFQLAYFVYFGVPCYLIDITLQMIIHAWLIILPVLLVSVSGFVLLLRWVAKKRGGLVIVAILLILFPTELAGAMAKSLYVQVFFALVELAVIANYIIWPLVTRRDIKKWGNRILASWEPGETDGRLFELVHKHVGPLPLLIVASGIICLFAAYPAGDRAAQEERNFLTFKDGRTTYAVVAMHGSHLLAIPVYEGDKFASGGIRLLPDSALPQGAVVKMSQGFGPIRTDRWVPTELDEQWEQVRSDWNRKFGTVDSTPATVSWSDSR